MRKSRRDQISQIFPSRPLDVARAHFDKSRSYSAAATHTPTRLPPLYVDPGDFLAFLAFSNIFEGSSLARGQGSLDLDEICQSRPLDVPKPHFD